MTWLRRRWELASPRLRVAWILGVVVAIGLVTNLVLHRDAITYAGTFVAIGAMTTPRAGATATLLADGRVLVAGGSADGKAALGSAELYNPSTGTFTATGSLATPRSSATAAILPDGRVLVTGGNGPDGSEAIAALSSAELYDPKTGTFTTTGSMTTARAYGSMTVLADGRVLVAGGSNHQDHLELATAEIYDPKTGAFAKTGSLVTGREGAAAALLPDGRVLIAGGAISIDSSTGPVTASAELYDPATGTFAATGPMAKALEWRATTLLIDGRVLIAGGTGLGDLLNGSTSAEIYDLTTGTFSPTGSMGSPIARPNVVGLADGRALVVGGLGAPQLYDWERGRFSATGPMLAVRNDGMTTILQNGQVLVAGGTIGTSNVASAELYR